LKSLFLPYSSNFINLERSKENTLLGKQFKTLIQYNNSTKVKKNLSTFKSIRAFSNMSEGKLSTDLNNNLTNYYVTGFCDA
jgi:hypothetical protein